MYFTIGFVVTILRLFNNASPYMSAAKFTILLESFLLPMQNIGNQEIPSFDV